MLHGYLYTAIPMKDTTMSCEMQRRLFTKADNLVINKNRMVLVSRICLHPTLFNCQLFRHSNFPTPQYSDNPIFRQIYM